MSALIRFESRATPEATTPGPRAQARPPRPEWRPGVFEHCQDLVVVQINILQVLVQPEMLASVEREVQRVLAELKESPYRQLTENTVRGRITPSNATLSRVSNECAQALLSNWGALISRAFDGAGPLPLDDLALPHNAAPCEPERRLAASSRYQRMLALTQGTERYLIRKSNLCACFRQFLKALIPATPGTAIEVVDRIWVERFKRGYVATRPE